jgi:hypothetical protein
MAEALPGIIASIGESSSLSQSVGNSAGNTLHPILSPYPPSPCSQSPLVQQYQLEAPADETPPPPHSDVNTIFPMISNDNLDFLSTSVSESPLGHAPLQAPLPLFSPSPSLGISVSTTDLLSSISPEERKMAQFLNTSSADTYDRIINFYSFQRVLSKAGINDKMAGTTSAHKPGSTLAHLLAHFGWNAHSYMHKLSWYTYANDIAQMEWKDGKPIFIRLSGILLIVTLLPDAIKPPDLYKTWQGIKAIWGPNGFIQRMQKPQKISANHRESAAATLTQKSIENAYKKYDKYLI